MSEWIFYPFCIYIQHRLNYKTNLHLRFNNRPERGLNSTEFEFEFYDFCVVSGKCQDLTDG